MSAFHKDDLRVPITNNNKESLKKSLLLNMPNPTFPQPTAGQIHMNQTYNQSSQINSIPKSRNLKKSLKLMDIMAAMYPGIKVGHKYCTQKTTLVPKTMGWLWNTEDTATGIPFARGYRPGAISLGVKRGKMLRPRSVSEMPNTPIGNKGRKIRKKGKTISSNYFKSETPTLKILTKQDKSPTLFVKKEGGVYKVLMQPIKDPGAGEDEEEEKPVQFKIAEMSENSSTRHSNSSSSSLKIEYVCTGSLRKPVKQPSLTEIGVQYDTADFTKIEKQENKQEKQTKIKEANDRKFTQKKEKSKK